MDERNPLTPGPQTSEYKISKQVIVASLITAGLGILGAVAVVITDYATSVPDSLWCSVALTGIGLVTAFLKSYGVDRSSATIKSAIAQASPEVLSSLQASLALKQTPPISPRPPQQ